MVKRLVISLNVVFAFLCTTLAYSGSFQDGVQAFKKKEYATAIEHFEKEIATDNTNVTAYFNLGLSYNAEKKFPEAIWAFERVLKLRPNDTEAIDNIEQNYLELDNGQKWKTDINRTERVLFSISSDNWSYFSIGFSILSAILILFIRKSKNTSLKRMLAITSILTIALMIFSIYIASSASSFERTHNYGVVIKDKIDTYKNSNKGNPVKTGVELDAGTKVKIIEKFKGSIRKVETNDGTVHFIDKSEFNKI